MSENSSKRSSSKESEGAVLRKREEALNKQLEEAKKQAQEAQRDDCTVLISRVPLNVDEKEMYSYFVKAGVGKIRDVRLIRDSRSGKSKG